jgi:2-iminobutanoate/2-iminopropanoate deaminase
MRVAVRLGVLVLLLGVVLFVYILLNKTPEAKPDAEPAASQMTAAQTQPPAERTIINGPSSGRPFSPAIRVGGTLYVSGQLAIGPEGNEVRDSFEAEVTQVLENIKRLVTEAGFEMNDVVKVTVYLADMADFDAMNKIYLTYFPENPPARECVAVKALARGFRIEIGCIAQK